MTERALKKYKPTTLLGLSCPLWFELIFKPYLFSSIKDCVALKRTCQFFASHEALQVCIREFENRVFGNFPAIHWNKMAIYDTPDHIALERDQHFLVYEHEPVNNIGYIRLGVYSEKDLLLVAFSAIIDLDVLKKHRRHTFSLDSGYIRISMTKEHPLCHETIIASLSVKEEWLNLYNQSRNDGDL